MVTERVDGGGGNLVRCGICGQYYDPGRHFGCPNCSGSSPALTEALYGRPAAGNGNSCSDTAPYSPVTEAVGRSSYSDVRNNLGNYGGMTEVAEHVEKRSPEVTRIVGRGGMFSPVVGWLIALNGPCRGTDYRLHTGYNYIGREKGDICIHGDLAISKERDSCINYDQNYRSFYLTHENGINQTLLNDRTVRKEAAELYDYDVVTIGQTKLLFISLCGERFNW